MIHVLSKCSLFKGPEHSFSGWSNWVLSQGYGSYESYVFLSQKKIKLSYLDLPKGAEWMIKGAHTPSLWRSNSTLWKMLVPLWDSWKCFLKKDVPGIAPDIPIKCIAPPNGRTKTEVIGWYSCLPRKYWSFYKIQTVCVCVCVYIYIYIYLYAP